MSTDRLTLRPTGEAAKDGGQYDGPHLLLAHGAGAPMTSAFMETLCLALAEVGVATTRFEFSYMAARRNGGRRRPPPKAEKLIPEYLDVVNAVSSDPNIPGRLAIGGKSMGGRVASMIAQNCLDAHLISALVCIGYPFHPLKKPQNLRTAHLMELTCPTLIVQGERDALGNRDEVAHLGLPGDIRVHWSADGDHDLSPRVRSGHTLEGNIRDAANAIAHFLQQLG